VPMLDDERFEKYLKQFRPIMPDALSLRQEGQGSWRRLSPLRKWALGVAAIVIIGTVAAYIGKGRVAHKVDNPASLEAVVPMQPLTMRDANALLSTAPSYKAAVDSLAFRSQGAMIPKDKQSAFAVLAKEKIKL
jgi:hypothetical protein